MTLEALETLLIACKMGDRMSQKRLYQQFYGLAMSVAVRYSANREEAQEICHDGFVKAFSKIADCKSAGSFKAWLRQIVVRSAIDYFRKYRQNQPEKIEIIQAAELSVANFAPDELGYDEKIQLVQKLSPTARMTFNLYVLEGFTTAEIAEQFGTAEGTVRANLAKARIQLQQLITQLEKTPELHG